MATVCAQPIIFGILNVTPDSFSDGGAFNSPGQAVERFKELLVEGADFIDVGAESTRPGAADVSEDEEWDRLSPVLDYAKKSDQIKRVSLDTRKFGIMRRGVELGVAALNHVGPLPEPAELSELFEMNPSLRFVACHMHGTPKTMQENPIGPASAIKRVRAFFEATLHELRAAGCASENIFLDPGIGFGKSDSANLALLFETAGLSQSYQLAMGISRKGFISRLLGITDLSSRDAASKVLEASLAACGAKLIRTHNVKILAPLLSTLATLTRGASHG